MFKTFLLQTQHFGTKFYIHNSLRTCCMKLLELRILRGPNFWSIKRHKLIQMLLDLEDLEYRPTSEIPGFPERIKSLIPSLYSHHCSEGHEGGFFERVQDGTWMGHVIEHIALEIQSLAGIHSSGFGRTRGSGIILALPSSGAVAI